MGLFRKAPPAPQPDPRFNDHAPGVCFRDEKLPTLFLDLVSECHSGPLKLLVSAQADDPFLSDTSCHPLRA